MKLVSTLIDEIKQDFEGGSSLACDWNIILRRSVMTALENINPTTLKKNVPIYGGFLKDMYVYYCPDNVRVPVALETNDKTRSFDYVPAKVFYKERKMNTFTIETLNGYRFLVTFQPASDATTIIDDMDSTTTISGTSTPIANEQNYLSGSQAIEGTFDDTGKTIGRTLTTTLDLSVYDRGTIIMPSYFKNAKNISSISFRLYTDATNYYSVSSSVDSIGSTFIDGWNRVRFLVKNLTPTLSPSLDTITKWEATITTTTGTTETVIVDNITIHKSAQWYLEYYSDQPFVDGVTNAWKDTVDFENDDLLNFSEDECGIVHYEACILLATNDSQRNVFASQLKRKYTNYYADNPSDAEPYTYNISEEIEMSVDGSVNNLAQRVPDPKITDEVTVVTLPNNSTHTALTQIDITSGAIDDSNLVFTFAEAPTVVIVNGAFASFTGTTTITLTAPVGIDGDIFGLV